MSRFKRYYVVSTFILSGFAVLSSISNIIRPSGMIGYMVGWLTVGCLPLIPLVLKGGILGNRKVAIMISVALAAAFGILLSIAFVEFVRTGGGEGPRGEGAPGAMIIAMTFFAAVFFCPWLLTALRGIRLWNITETSDPPQATR